MNPYGGKLTRCSHVSEAARDPLKVPPVVGNVWHGNECASLAASLSGLLKRLNETAVRRATLAIEIAEIESRLADDTSAVPAMSEKHAMRSALITAADQIALRLQQTLEAAKTAIDVASKENCKLLTAMTSRNESSLQQVMANSMLPGG